MYPQTDLRGDDTSLPDTLDRHRYLMFSRSPFAIFFSWVFCNFFLSGREIQLRFCRTSLKRALLKDLLPFASSSIKYFPCSLTTAVFLVWCFHTFSVQRPRNWSDLCDNQTKFSQADRRSISYVPDPLEVTKVKMPHHGDILLCSPPLIWNIV